MYLIECSLAPEFARQAVSLAVNGTDSAEPAACSQDSPRFVCLPSRYVSRCAYPQDLLLHVSR